MSLFKKLAQLIASEPATAISTFILSVIGWVGPIFWHNFDASAVDEKFGSAATALGLVIGLIVRQFVTPNTKVVEYIDSSGQPVERPRREPQPLSPVDPAVPGDAK